jgi:hypothetical protein
MRLDVRRSDVANACGLKDPPASSPRYKPTCRKSRKGARLAAAARLR